MTGEVWNAEWSWHLVKAAEESQFRGEGVRDPGPVRAYAGSYELPHSPGGVEDADGGAAGMGEGASRVHDFPEDGGEVEAAGDTEGGFAQGDQARESVIKVL